MPHISFVAVKDKTLILYDKRTGHSVDITFNNSNLLECSVDKIDTSISLCDHLRFAIVLPQTGLIWYAHSHKTDATSIV